MRITEYQNLEKTKQYLKVFELKATSILGGGAGDRIFTAKTDKPYFLIGVRTINTNGAVMGVRLEDIILNDDNHHCVALENSIYSRYLTSSGSRAYGSIETTKYQGQEIHKDNFIAKNIEFESNDAFIDVTEKVYAICQVLDVG
jgi:hypothetical protein